MSDFIKLKKISKSFQLQSKIKALKNIDLRFQLGKIYSLVGPSGSGKSTLLNLISLIDVPSSGKIFIDQKNIISGDQDLMIDLELAQLE